MLPMSSKVLIASSLSLALLLTLPARGAAAKAGDAVAPSATAPATHRRYDNGLDPLPIAADANPTGAGLRVIIDPQTHELLDAPATPDQAQRIREDSQRIVAPDYNKMTTEVQEDGTVVLHTNGQLMMTSSVRLNADGSYEEICVPGAASKAAIAPAKADPGPTP